MSNSGIMIPDDIKQIIEDRNKLWVYHDESHNLANQLEKLGRDFASNTPAEMPAQLTSDGIPPAEVASALSMLQKEMSEISEAQRKIREHKDEIARIEASRRQAIIIAVIAIVIILLIIYANMAH